MTSRILGSRRSQRRCGRGLCPLEVIVATVLITFVFGVPYLAYNIMLHERVQSERMLKKALFACERKIGREEMRRPDFFVADTECAKVKVAASEKGMLNWKPQHVADEEAIKAWSDRQE